MKSLGWVVIQCDSVFIKRGRFDIEIDTHRENAIKKMKAEIQVIHLQAKDHQRLPTNHQKRESSGTDCLSQPSEHLHLEL